MQWGVVVGGSTGVVVVVWYLGEEEEGGEEFSQVFRAHGVPVYCELCQQGREVLNGEGDRGRTSQRIEQANELGGIHVLAFGTSRRRYRFCQLRDAPFL
jgi:hypothetical protein